MSTSNNTTHAEQQVDARLSPFEKPAEEPVQKELKKTPKRKREDDAEATRPAEHVPVSPSKKSKIIVDLTTDKKTSLEDQKKIAADDELKDSEELPGVVIDLTDKRFRLKHRHLNPELLEKYDFKIGQQGEKAPPGVVLVVNMNEKSIWDDQQCGGMDLMHFFDFTSSYTQEATYCTAEANKFEQMVDELAMDLDLARSKLREGINRWLTYMTTELKWKMSEMRCEDYLQLRYMLLTVDWIFPELQKRGKLFKEFNKQWQYRHRDLKAIRDDDSDYDSDSSSDDEDNLQETSKRMEKVVEPIVEQHDDASNKKQEDIETPDKKRTPKRVREEDHQEAEQAPVKKSKTDSNKNEELSSSSVQVSSQQPTRRQKRYYLRVSQQTQTGQWIPCLLTWAHKSDSLLNPMLNGVFKIEGGYIGLKITSRLHQTFICAPVWCADNYNAWLFAMQPKVGSHEHNFVKKFKEKLHDILGDLFKVEVCEVGA
jgi:hypothetical protein